MIAYSDASAALERRDAERCWYSLQGLIAAAMQLHQLLWPSPNGTLSWARELRGALEVTDDSPLNGAPLLSASELDHTLELWSAPRPVSTHLLPDFSTVSFGDSPHAECVRSFDPETGMFTLFGNVVELLPLLNAIADLAPKTERELAHLREVV